MTAIIQMEEKGLSREQAQDRSILHDQRREDKEAHKMGKPTGFMEYAQTG